MLGLTHRTTQVKICTTRGPGLCYDDDGDEIQRMIKVRRMTMQTILMLTKTMKCIRR